MEAGAELIARARLICGEQHVLTGATVLSVYRSDGIRRNGQLPLAAILPGSSSEVASVVGACAAGGIPFVVRGAGTSHGGGALPRADGVSIVLTRMRRILAASASELTAEAGVPLTALPRSATQCWVEGEESLGTIGGHIAETSAVSNVAAIDLVRPDGRLVHLDARGLGYDVVGAFSGSRGRAGIAVTITLNAVAHR